MSFVSSLSLEKHEFSTWSIPPHVHETILFWWHLHSHYLLLDCKAFLLLSVVQWCFVEITGFRNCGWSPRCSNFFLMTCLFCFIVFKFDCSYLNVADIMDHLNCNMRFELNRNIIICTWYVNLRWCLSRKGLYFVDHL